jgi:hypothetical protein
VLCIGGSCALFFHNWARITVATTARFHRATSFNLFLLVALSGGLGACSRCKQHQPKQHRQNSVLTGVHFLFSSSKDL